LKNFNFSEIFLRVEASEMEGPQIFELTPPPLPNQIPLGMAMDKLIN
jgi:hypothetical protein